MPWRGAGENPILPANASLSTHFPQKRPAEEKFIPPERFTSSPLRARYHPWSKIALELLLPAPRIFQPSGNVSPRSFVWQSDGEGRTG